LSQNPPEEVSFEMENAKLGELEITNGHLRVQALGSAWTTIA
jgi:hypothetical protein